MCLRCVLDSGRMMKRLISVALFVVSSFYDGALLAFVLLWLLPHIGLRLPTALTWGILGVWVAWSAITFLPTKRAREKKAFSPTEALIGRKGVAATRLAPDGMVKIDGELWDAVSAAGTMEKGQQIVVAAVSGLKLTVRVA